MEIKELVEFSIAERRRLRHHFPIDDLKTEIFSRMTKIMEELGELCEAILSHFSLQRKDKPLKGKRDIENEIADTIIGLFLLAHQIDIDVEKALKKKMEIIKSRNY